MKKAPCPYSWSSTAKLVGALAYRLHVVAIWFEDRARNRFFARAKRHIGLEPHRRPAAPTEALPGGIDWDQVRASFDTRNRRHRS